MGSFVTIQSFLNSQTRGDILFDKSPFLSVSLVNTLTLLKSLFKHFLVHLIIQYLTIVGILRIMQLISLKNKPLSQDVLTRIFYFAEHELIKKGILFTKAKALMRAKN